MTQLSDLTSTEIATITATGPTVLLVPVGSTEQHGPHLPVTTDTDIALALARRAATDDPHTVVAPAVAYGSSGEHQGFAGTISIGQQATEHLLIEFFRSAAATFDLLVCVSAHGGNAEPVRRAIDQATSESISASMWTPPWRGDAHAGRTETSLMLALAPDRVRLDHMVPGNTAPLTELLPRLRNEGVLVVSANGVLGDPTGATAVEGDTLMDLAVDDLVNHIRAIRRDSRSVEVH